MSGSGADRGFDYQADAFAYIAAHALAEQPLGWFDDLRDVPVAIQMETGGPGDDIRVDLVCGIAVEIQVKHGLTKPQEFWEAMRSLGQGLVADERLRGVLFVDDTASGTIKNDLRNDVTRVGQGVTGNLKGITQEVISYLDEHNISASQVFPRFRVVVVNLTEGSHGVAAATALLANVVQSGAQALNAWTLLGKEGHRLIKNRGRRDVRSLVQVLARHVELSDKCTNRQVVTERYRQWLLKSNDSFLVPTLNVSLPIAEAWSQLRFLEDEVRDIGPSQDALARQIAAYHEWARFAETRHYTSSAIAAEDAILSSKHAVIIGGPGSGKSTLQRRLTHWAAENGKTTVHVLLKPVSQLIARGYTFEQAMCEVATDGADIADQDASSILASADFLLADGLDECDPGRQNVAGKLLSWTNGHPNCHVCVTTRPVGHEPGLLPGFRHAELLPLDETTVPEYARKLFEATIHDPASAAHRWKGFVEEVGQRRGGNKVATIAARNPLLLTFLVRLFLNDVPSTGHRAGLFQQILTLVQKTPPTSRLSQEKPREDFALSTIEAIGWALIASPGQSASEVAFFAVRDLENSYGIPAGQLRDGVEGAIEFWEDRRLLERLTAGHLDALTFVHLSLGEYAAGRYIARMDDRTFSEWLYRSRRQPQWREPIVFAAGHSDVERIVRSLLHLDNVSDPTSTEAILAAAALTEAESATDELTTAVVRQLSARLESDIPLVATEAAQGLLSLARLAPELIGGIAKPLLQHEQRWTRQSAVALALAAGGDFISLEQTVSWLDSFQLVGSRHPLGMMSIEPREAYELQATALLLAIGKVLDEMESDDANPYLERLLAARHISFSMMKDVLQLLKRRNCSELLAAVNASLSFRIPCDYQAILERSRKTDAAVLEALLAATGHRREAAAVNEDLRPIGVASVYGAMGIHEVEWTDWELLGRRIDPDVVVEVMRGVIAALDLDPSVVALEANVLLDRLEAAQDYQFDILPQVPADPHWELADCASLDLSKVARGLCHPSAAVRYVAAHLLVPCDLTDNERLIILEILNSGHAAALEIVGKVAGAIWEDGAARVLLDRLNRSLDAGCEYLYEPLVKLGESGELDEVRDAVLAGCYADSPSVATGAAKAIEKLPESMRAAMASQLHSALEHWTERGSWCEKCDIAVHDGSCPNCHVLPPNPRPHFVRQLARLGEVSIDELLALCEDNWHNVREAAIETLAEAAQEDEMIMIRLLEEIGDDSAPLALLDALLELPPDAIRPVATEALNLAESSVARVRARLMSSLTEGWVDDDTANDRAHEALNDPDPTVRDAATRTLRSLDTKRREH